MLIQRRGVGALFFVCLVVTTLGCGGGGTANRGVATATQPQAATTYFAESTTFSYEGQTGLGGEVLRHPVMVRLLRSDNTAAGGAIVRFATTSGADLFPTVVTTTPAGYARVLVRLPHKPLQQITVTATADGGATKDLKFNVGPDVVSVFGNTIYGGYVSADGRVIGQDILGANGTLQFRSGIAASWITVPEDILRWASLGANQNIYVGIEGLELVFDSSYHPLRAIDVLYSNGNGSPASTNYRGPTWGDTDGTIYLGCSPATMVAPDGHVAGTFGPAQNEMQSCSVTPSGKIMALSWSNLPSHSRTISEYSRDGTIRRTILDLDALARRVVVGQDGNIYVEAYKVVQVFSGAYALLATLDVSLPNRGQMSDLAGADLAGDVFFQDTLPGSGAIVRMDKSGSWISCSGICDYYPGAVAESGGVPEGGTASDVIMLLAAESGTDAVYFYHLGVGQSYITAYRGGIYQGRIPFPSAPDSLVAVGGQLQYVTGILGSGSLVVLSTAGTVIRQTAYPQFQLPSGLAVASDGTRYVFDGTAGVIHVISADDTYLRGIPLTTGSVYDGEIAAGPDGNLVYCQHGMTVGTLAKVSPSGSQLWTKSTRCGSVAIDSSNRIFYSGGDDGLSLGLLDGNGSSITSTYFPYIRIGGGGDSIYAANGDGRVYRLTVGQ